MNNNSREIYAKLMTDKIIQDAKILSNPRPYLEKAYKEMYIMRKLLDDIHLALSPMPTFDLGIEMHKSTMDLVGLERLRNQKALEIINNYLSSKNE